jgi:TPR repeat protein
VASKPVDKSDWDIEALKKQSAVGSPDAQFALALCYTYGSHGVTKNTEKAKLLLEMAALQGHDGAKLRLEKFDQETKELEKSEK